MKNHKLFILPLVALSVLFCGTHQGDTGADRTVEHILSDMRSDRALAATLDSLAQLSIGPGARWLDAVKHTFSWDGRLWVFNDDWGGVLEIPGGYIPKDDRIQAELTYHGTAIPSLDSAAFILNVEGYQSLSIEVFREECLAVFDSDSLLVGMTSREEVLRFADGTESPALVYETLYSDGYKGYFRYIYKDPGSVVYAISFHCPADREGEYSEVMKMVGRYPIGPLGQDPEIRC